ncbi:GlsB/YeaQ/YmgE family stress response membrane protein [Streptomyces genisteinicus]|uniref:GlsB/YeaQ/YmgE family stress response membrane protein n=1 Tax=Streptomyces genisteinicus TaxID=2768068 RepID=A0A7H0I242_9ACTN|nr:GlsB/YeaQ/YmgE family stress response membrane protein [Streptomyces genisteinicus]QNP66858.1 GlsB/YeaQ/YmgE family stress response membrane protein [Streptomyces genisteinicus]
MDVSGVLSALVAGTAAGVLGRLFLPGHQHIGVLWTIVAGVAAALVGSLLAAVAGVGDGAGGDWLEFLAQVVLAALAVAGLDRWLRASL